MPEWELEGCVGVLEWNEAASGYAVKKQLIIVWTPNRAARHASEDSDR